MDQPLIVVDIDDVLSSSAQEFVDFSNDRWGTSLTVEDYQEDWAKMWKVDIKELQKRANHFYKSGIVAKHNRLDDSWYALLELSKTFDIVLVTSRPLALESETRAWIDQNYQGIVKEIRFSGIYDGSLHDGMFSKTKANIFEELKPAFVIDDQPKHCYAAAKLGLKTILFGDYSWNRHVEIQANMTRCHNWQEVLEVIEANAKL